VLPSGEFGSTPSQEGSLECFACLSTVGLIWGVWDNRSPNDPNRLAIKRILGLAGDTVRTLPPSQANEGPTVPSKVTVPYGHMWVEGESRHRTLDSNTYGAIPINMIVGQVKGVVWPWRRRGWLRWTDWKEEEGRVEVAPKGSVKAPKHFKA
jgi:Signal peptidase, peptidase S26